MESYSRFGKDDADTSRNGVAQEQTTPTNSCGNSDQVGAPSRAMEQAQLNNDTVRASMTAGSLPNERLGAYVAQRHSALPSDHLLSWAAPSVGGQQAQQLYGQPLLVDGANQRHLSVFGTTTDPMPNSNSLSQQASSNLAMIQAAEMTQLWSQHLANLQQSFAVAAASHHGGAPTRSVLGQASPMLTAATFQQMMPTSSYFPQNLNSGLVATSASGSSSSSSSTGRSLVDTASTATSTTSPTNSAVHHQQPQHATSKSSSNKCKAPMALYLDQDEMELSPYQCLVRKQIEVFEQPGSRFHQEEITTQGRNRPIIVGQVGLRCRHCARVPPRSRSKYAMLFPSTLVGAYQSAQNMANTHLLKTCTMIPEATRNELIQKRTRDKGQKTCKSAYGGGRQYWADCLRVLGVIDSEDRRLRFSSSEVKSRPYPMESVNGSSH
jgi:hypothetical protein